MKVCFSLCPPHFRSLQNLVCPLLCCFQVVRIWYEWKSTKVCIDLRAIRQRLIEFIILIGSTTRWAFKISLQRPKNNYPLCEKATNLKKNPTISTNLNVEQGILPNCVSRTAMQVKYCVLWFIGVGFIGVFSPRHIRWINIYFFTKVDWYLKPIM